MSKEPFSDTLTKVTKNTSALSSDTFHDTRVAARSTTKDLGGLADAVQSDTMDGVRQLTTMVEDESSKAISHIRSSIQEHPTLTIGIIAGMGVLIGLMLSGRR